VGLGGPAKHVAKNDSTCLLPVVVLPSTPVLPIGFGWVWVGLGTSISTVPGRIKFFSMKLHYDPISAH
jgi:hypothetical protein